MGSFSKKRMPLMRRPTVLHGSSHNFSTIYFAGQTIAHSQIVVAQRSGRILNTLCCIFWLVMPP